MILYLHKTKLKMKKALLLFAVVTLAYSCDKTESLPPNTYEITVSAKGVYNGIRAYIKNTDDPRREIIIDTAIVMNETFSFNGKVENASLLAITINGIKGNLPFVLEPGKINIEVYKDSISSSTINGSKNNEDYNVFKKEYSKKTEDINSLRLQINEARRLGDNELYSELNARYSFLRKKLVLYNYQFIDENPDSDFSLFLLEKLINNKNQEVVKIKNGLATLKKVINKNAANKRIGKKIEDFINILQSQENLNLGKVAPNFSAPTPEGKTLSLNDIKGKATIIDFWASWCKPCRRENPNVVRVFEKYHEKGLEIISVSLDKDGQKERWLKAIDDDNMNWHHVSNLKFWNEPVARQYNINSIPATFILDENGVIVAKKLRGDALEQKIAELLD
jgi:thiol-disulfide isomerase/thioredoxin